MTFQEGRQALARGTVRRFLLLLSVLLMTCMFMVSTMALAARPGSFRECARAAAVDLDGLLPEIRLAASDAFGDCAAGVAAGAGRAALVGTGLVVLAALTLYWWLPVWRGRRGRLVPVGAGPTAAERGSPTEPLSVQLTRLTRRAGVSREPAFVVDPSALTAGAVVFGRAGRYTVCLHAGLIPRRTTDPRMFEAVLLHELAHIRNRDVDITYLTVALWRVVLPAVLLPYLLFQSWLLVQRPALSADRTYWAEAAPSLGKVAFGGFLVALVYLVRADVLRSRELCADLDALASGADPAVWGAPQLARAGGGPATGARAGLLAVVRWFTGLWRTHPTWAQRHRALTRSTMADPGGTGLQALLFMAAVPVLMYPMWAPWPMWLSASVAYVVAPLVVAAWIASLPAKMPRLIGSTTGGPWWSAPAGGVGPAGHGQPGRPPRIGWRLLLVVAVVGALFALDPLGGFDDDASAGRLAPPRVPVARTGQRPMTAVRTGAHRGGREATG